MSQRGIKRERSPSHDSVDRESQGLFMTPAPSTRWSTIPPEDEFADSGVGSEADDDDQDLDEDIYNAAYEPKPKMAAYDPVLSKIKQSAHELACDLASRLRSHTYASQDIVNMCAKADAAVKTTVLKKKTIMLLGNTGTGKSSTVNSFVDDAAASKAVAGGESCTAVPTLLTYRLDDQQSPYAAEVRFFDSATRRAFLEEQLLHYIKFHFEADPLWEKEEKQGYENRADAAEKVFRALFCDQDDFTSPRAVKEYLGQKYDPLGKQLVLDRMNAWSEALFAGLARLGDQPYVRFEAQTAEELDFSVEPHIFEKPDFDEPALFPLVEHLRKGFMGSDILLYVDILDLPGTADVNSVRSGVAHKFVQNSDALWVVGGLRRILADEHVDQMLATYAEKFGNHVVVIATSSDAHVDDNLIKVMKDRKQSVQPWHDLNREIKAAREKITVLAAKLKRDRSSKRARRLSHKDEADLRAKKSDYEEQKQRLEDEQFEFAVDSNNEFITNRLKADKQKHLTRGCEVEAFCISNTQYMSLKGFESGDSRQLSAKATGIPALRECALKMAAPEQFRAIEDTIQKVIILLRGAALWVDSTPTSCNDRLLNIVKEPIKLLDAYTNDYLNEITAPAVQSSSSYGNTGGAVNAELIHPLRAGLSSFILAALKVKDRIGETTHPSSIRAFFRKDGRHQPKNQQYAIWNENFTAEQVETIVDPGWERVVSKQNTSLQGMVKNVKKQIADIPDQLAQVPSAVPLPVARVEELVTAYNNRIQIAYDSRIDEMKKHQSNLKLDASRDVDTAYFTTAMRPMYERAKARTGDGCTKNMMADLNAELNKQGNASPFAAVHNGLERDLTEAANLVARNIQADIKIILQEMCRQFEAILRTEQAAPGDMAARSLLRPFLQSKLGEVNSIEEQLIEIKQKYQLNVVAWLRNLKG